MFQKVVDRPVNIGHFNRVLWISLADSDPRLQCVFLREIEGFRSLRLRLALVRQHETLRFGESSGRI